MDDLISLFAIGFSVCVFIIAGAIGIGIGHIILVWCGVL